MNDDQKIRSRAPKRESRCYQTQRDIVIPAGTILREAANERGGKAFVEAAIGFGPDFTGDLVVQVHADAEASGFFKQVIA